MSLWKQITCGNAARAVRRRPHQTRPGLEAMESRALLSGGGASFKLVNGDLYERQGRHQSLVASDVVYFRFANKHAIIFGEANGNVYKKTISGAPQLIQAGPSTPILNPPTSPHEPPSPSPSPTPNPTPQPANIPPGTYDYYYSQTTGEETVTNKFTMNVYADGTAEIQLAIQSSDSPFASSPVQLDYFRWLGRLQAHGSELEHVGEGTEVFTDASNPALDYQRFLTDDFLFPFYQWVQGKGLELTLAKELPDFFSPNGLTRNILLTKIA